MLVHAARAFVLALTSMAIFKTPVVQRRIKHVRTLVKHELYPPSLPAAPENTNMLQESLPSSRYPGFNANKARVWMYPVGRSWRPRGSPELPEAEPSPDPFPETASQAEPLPQQETSPNLQSFAMQLKSLDFFTVWVGCLLIFWASSMICYMLGIAKRHGMTLWGLICFSVLEIWLDWGDSCSAMYQGMCDLILRAVGLFRWLISMLQGMSASRSQAVPVDPSECVGTVPLIPPRNVSIPQAYVPPNAYRAALFEEPAQETDLAGLD